MSCTGREGSSPSQKGKERVEDGAGGIGRGKEEVELSEGKQDLGDLYGAAAGWVEARTSCPHLPTMPVASADDLSRVPPPDSPCSRCHHPAENWLCLICKDVLCSRFINKHMLFHYQEAGHCLALSFRNTVCQHLLHQFDRWTWTADQSIRLVTTRPLTSLVLHSCFYP